MEEILMYIYVDEITHKKVISYNPLPATSCSIRHYLIADDNNILVNSETGQKTRAIIVPEWEKSQWIEQGI